MNDMQRIRNIGIIAHIDAGKTTTTERMLFYSGKTHRIGEVDDGNTVMDYLDEERERGITIISAAATFLWGDYSLQLIDTPGHIDFTAEVERSLRVIDGAVVIFSGMEGVEAQSETVWRQADHYSLPRLAFINKLDRLGASFDRVFGEINDTFQNKGVALTMPVGVESDFASVVDLISMEHVTFEGDEGETVVRSEIPADALEDAQLAQMDMIERLADRNDEIAELFLMEEEIPVDLIRRTVRELTLENQIIPVFVGSAKKDVGIQLLMDAVVAYLPSPLDVGDVAGTTVKDDSPTSIAPEASAPFGGLVFKIKASPSADLYYLRTYSGTLKANDDVFVPRLNKMVRVKRLLRLYAQKQEAINEVGPGDIIGFIGPKDIQTGDTLCSRHNAISFESMVFPEPVISMALEPKSSKDRDRLDESLDLICREDPTLDLKRDENTGQRILSGMGELHLEITAHRLENEFKVEPRFGAPRVAYRETLKKPIEVATTFQRTIGEQEIVAGVKLSFRPDSNLPTPIHVESKLRGAFPNALVNTALQGMRDGLVTGGNFGYPLINVAGELIDIVVSGEKTTEGAVLGAVLQALDQAIREAGTVMLEPIMSLEIVSPEEFVGTISNDIQTRNGIILHVGELVGVSKMECEVPLAAMFGFSKALPKLTGGRGAFSMEPHGYRECQSGQGS
jgi:elongation factor G